MFAKALCIAAVLVASLTCPAWAEGKGGSVHVRGYYPSNGTYVQPHMRSAPDGNFSNNWSTKGNINPYTGVPGTKTHNPNKESGGGNSSYPYSREIERLVGPLPTSATTEPAGQSPADGVEFRADAPAEPGGGITGNPGVDRPSFDAEREKSRRDALKLAEKGFARFQANEFRQAITEYSWAIDSDPWNARLFYCRGTSFSRLGRYDEAISDLNQAILLSPEFKEAHVGLGYAHSRKGALLSSATNR
jgi:tetratricopeptide (TPR) repeat protein